MKEIIHRPPGVAAAAGLVVIAGLLAACSPGPSGPAPVYIGGTGPTATKVPPAMTAAPPPRIVKAPLPPMAKGPPPRTSSKIASDVIPLDASPAKPIAA